LPNIRFKSLTCYERKLLLSGTLSFENCNVHINASLGLNYSLIVQYDDDPNRSCHPNTIQDLKRFYNVIDYDFDELYGTDVLGYLKNGSTEKSPISSGEILGVDKQNVKYLNDKTSNSLSISSFSINEVQGVAFYIEAHDVVTVSSASIYFDTHSYQSDVYHLLAEAFIQLKTKVLLLKIAERISTCDGIHPLAYAILSYARDHTTLPVNTKPDIELLWKYMVDEFGLTSVNKKQVKAKAGGATVTHDEIWKLYDKTYCKKVFNELVALTEH
jgi:hypothetical protein